MQPAPVSYKPVIHAPIADLPQMAVRTDMYINMPKGLDLKSFQAGMAACQTQLNAWAANLTRKQNDRIESVVAQANDYVDAVNEVVVKNNMFMILWTVQAKEREAEAVAQLAAPLEQRANQAEAQEAIWREAAEAAWAENQALREALERIGKAKTIGEVRGMVNQFLGNPAEANGNGGKAKG